MQRIRSLDVLRGLIMALMAIDHVRLYGGIPAGGETLPLYFTRWITHFCAPGFAFFAGTSIFLTGRKMSSTHTLSRFLLTRGLLLVLLEITLIRFLWAFKINYAQFFLAGVIWMLGWSMVIMALLVKAKPRTVGISGLIIIAVQQAFHYVPLLLPEHLREGFGLFWNFIYPSGIPMPANIAVLYVIVPWIGVMAAGYWFGQFIMMEEKKRKQWCIRIGLSAIVLFIVIGSLILLTAKEPGGDMPFLLRLLNQNKYPASQLFLLMTLGPLIALVPAAEKMKGALANFLTVLGRAPMFFYLLHILVIHLSALLVNEIRDGNAHMHWYDTAPFYTTQPPGIRMPLSLLYLVWFIDLLILYAVCRWYVQYKSRHPEKKWLSYL